MLGAFGLPMSKVTEGEIVEIAREVFDIPGSEHNVAVAIFMMTKKQRARVARARAPAIAERLRQRAMIEKPLTQEDADAAERKILAMCRSSIRRMTPGESRARCIAVLARTFGERAARGL